MCNQLALQSNPCRSWGKGSCINLLWAQIAQVIWIYRLRSKQPVFIVGAPKAKLQLSLCNHQLPSASAARAEQDYQRIHRLHQCVINCRKSKNTCHKRRRRLTEGLSGKSLDPVFHHARAAVALVMSVPCRFAFTMNTWSWLLDDFRKHIQLIVTGAAGVWANSKLNASTSLHIRNDWHRMSWRKWKSEYALNSSQT